MSGRLEGKVAVVTGGGNGIGRACCTRFAEEGATVVVSDVLDEGGHDTLAAVEAAGGTGSYFHLDATDEAGNEALAAHAVEAHGSLDVLVTAAGISHADYRSGDHEAEQAMLASRVDRLLDPVGAFLDLPATEWQRVLDVNLNGTYLAVRAAARRMHEGGRGGSIVTIASIAAKRPEAGPVAYAVSKAGVWMLTKHAARTLGPVGIRVNAIGPGYIETNMTRIISGIPEAQQLLLGGIPMGRMGQPSEVASTALFLASDESSYFTGEILHPDGGFYTD